MATTAKVGRLRDVHSSSPGLSSPPSPHSPSNPTSLSPSGIHPHAVLPSQKGNVDSHVGGGEVTKANLAKVTNTSAPKKVSRPRKKKEIDGAKSSTATANEGREPPKARKPRGTPGVVVKRRSKASAEANDAKLAGTHVVQRQTKITESLPSPAPPPDFGVLTFPSHQNGKVEAIPAPPDQNHNTMQTNSRPSSGQNYDPIRSSTIEPRSIVPGPIIVKARASTPPRPVHQPSASPGSIASIIEPPQQYTFLQSATRDGETVGPSPPLAKKPRLSPQPAPAQPSFPSISRESLPPALQASKENGAMDVDTDHTIQVSEKASSLVKKSSSSTPGASSTAHSPKPARKKESAVPLPSGNGLLSGSIFGGGFDGAGPGKAAPTVVLHVALDTENKYVNFARLAEERYGFNALHPRLAAQQERLARVAAAGAALENAHKNSSGMSADEMSLDLSEGEGDGEASNVEMGGMGLDGAPRSGGEGSEGPVKKAPKKRMMKEDMYDKDDPFVDDTELAWEEQAAASKDGFFVYSGPLVPPGEDANIERSVFPASNPQHSRLTNPTGPTQGERNVAAAAAGAEQVSREAPDEPSPPKTATPRPAPVPRRPARRGNRGSPRRRSSRWSRKRCSARAWRCWRRNRRRFLCKASGGLELCGSLGRFGMRGARVSTVIIAS